MFVYLGDDMPGRIDAAEGMSVCQFILGVGQEDRKEIPGANLLL
jgi:hypothetical protein